MSKTILVTGASGALGTVLLPRLLARKHRVICLEHTHRVIGCNEVRIIRGDIRERNCGISLADLNHLLHRVDGIVHAAASIKFSDDGASEVINVAGVKNVLSLADALGVSSVYHVSTAYIAGDAAVFGEADLNIGQQFRNTYERTKYESELLVRRWADKRSGRYFTIFRPSILIGAEVASTPTFSGFFAFCHVLNRIAQYLRDQAAKSEGWMRDGLRIHRDNKVEVPLVIEVSRSSTLNLIPVDWVCDMMAGYIGLAPRNKNYHLVHPAPPLARWIFDICLPLLGFERIELVETAQEKRAILEAQLPRVTSLQRHVDFALKAFYPYLKHEACFSMHNCRELPEFREPDPISADFLISLVERVINRNWRRPNEPANEMAHHAARAQVTN